MHSLLLCLLVAQAPSQTPAPEGTGLVTGRVVDAVSNKPVSAAVVMLRTGGATVGPAERVLTDNEGRYFSTSSRKAATG
jgi:hypothetical protein